MRIIVGVFTVGVSLMLAGTALAWPYQENFDDLLLQQDWQLQSDWAITGANVQFNRSGAYRLDSNPNNVSQPYHSGTASLNRTFTVPAVVAQNDAPVLSFWYQLTLINPSDRVWLEVLPADSVDWQSLAVYDSQWNTGNYVRQELSLLELSGQSFQLRFRMYNSWSNGPRTFRVDDMHIGPRELDLDLDYPYGSDFEVLESIHDGSGDSIAENDLGGRSDWLLSGDWGFSDSDSIHSGHTEAWHLDNNLSFENQYNHVDHTAELAGWLHLPLAGPEPTLSMWYKLDLLTPSDRIWLEIQEQGQVGWSLLRTWDPTWDHNAYTREDISLDNWRDKEIRIRFRQKSVNVYGARLFVMDDLYIGPLVLPLDLDYPYVTDFETLDSVHDGVGDTEAANDVNGRSDWMLNGDWSGAEQNGLRENHTPLGTWLLDNNSTEVNQYNHVDHSATLDGWITLPAATALPTLSYWYKLDLLTPSDRVWVELQVQGSKYWQVLKSYDYSWDHSELTRQDLDLSAWAGQEIRLRFRQKSVNVYGSRLFVVDDLRVGDHQLPYDFDFPYFCDFESSTSVHDGPEDSLGENDVCGRPDWNGHASWYMRETTGIHDNHTPLGSWHLDNNPSEVNQYNYVNQPVSMNGWLELPNTGVALNLSFWYKLDTINISDYISVQIQLRDSTSWSEVEHLGPKQNEETSEWLQVCIPLDDWAGQEVRVRFRQYFVNNYGNRLFLVDDLAVSSSCEQQTADTNERGIVSQIELRDNYPNPFNPSTEIRFQLPETGLVRLSVYDLQGRLVAVLHNGLLSSGQHQMQFNATGLSSGIYFSRLEVEGQVHTRKMMLIK